MKLTTRTSKRHRKKKPMVHRSFAQKRGRLDKQIKKEMDKYLKR